MALAMQGAWVTALKADTAVAAIVGVRVYDYVPPTTPFPHIEVGDVQCIDASAGLEFAAAECFVDIHVWSRPGNASAYGAVEARTLGGVIENAFRFDNERLQPAGYLVLVQQFQRARYMRDPDGLTQHGVLTFRTLVQSPPT